MQLRIFNDATSLSAQRSSGVPNERLGKTLDRIATGIQINKSADDEAGLTLSDRLHSDTHAHKLGAVDSFNLGFSEEDLTTTPEALSAIDSLVQALDQLNGFEAEVGTVQAKLEKALDSLNVSIKNFTVADTELRDADSASELTLFTRDQILAQSATAKVGQANLIPQGVFELIEGL